MRTDYRTSTAGQRRFRFKRIYRVTYWLQTVLWKCGIPWHNTFSDECTADFNCCCPTPASTYPRVYCSWLWMRNEEATVLFGFAGGRVEYEPEAKWLYSARLFLGLFRIELNWTTGKGSGIGIPEVQTPDPEPNYDMNIHTNPDARAWARFFMETKAQTPTIADDEECMVGWFANAMMAMHDHMEGKRQREALSQGTAAYAESACQQSEATPAAPVPTT